MRKTQVIVIPLVAVSFLLGACSAAPTPGEKEIAFKALEDVIPLTISGFIFVEKGNRVEPVGAAATYSAYSIFKPKANTKFKDKVENVEVWVFLYKDDVAAGKWYNAWIAADTDFAEISQLAKIQVNGKEAMFTYDNYTNIAYVHQQLGKFIIRSSAIAPFEAIIDKQVLKDAAIEGLKAIRF